MLLLGVSIPTAAFADGAVYATASASAPNVQPGASVVLTAAATSETDVEALIDIEVYDPTGWRAYQRFADHQPLHGRQATQFGVEWAVPVGARTGTYTVKVGVTQANWGQLYVWNDHAATFEVSSSPSPGGSPVPTSTSAPVGVPKAFAISVAQPAGPIAPGSAATLAISVDSPFAVNALIDFEIYRVGGGQVWQSFLDNQSLPAGRRTFSVPWRTDPALPMGSYTLKVGVVQPNWGALYVWSDNAASLIVGPSTAPSPTASPTPAATPQTSPTPVSTALPSPTPAPTLPPGAGATKLFGINLAGGEFTPSSVPGAINTSYIYPADPVHNLYFATRGQRLVRLPILWERVQPAAFDGLSHADLVAIRVSLDSAQAAGQQVILELHNYGRYRNAPLGRADTAAFADIWRQLAQTFQAHPALYGYELMNEPHDLPDGADGWAALAQAATDGIRQVDRAAWVLVPGYGWQGAWTWPQQNPSLNIQDASGRLVYAAHQYFDADGSGTYTRSYDAQGAYPGLGSDRLRPFLDWLTTHNARGMLTEYGVPRSDPRWLAVLDNFMATLSSTPAIQGGTYWAAGPWWGAYPLSAEPTNGVDAPQMSVLSRYPSR